jgi:hypothetical protein
MVRKKYFWLLVGLAFGAAIIFTILRFSGAKTSFLGNLIFASTITPVSAYEIQAYPGPIRSFGDNFSGLGYIDRNQTDLFLDYNVSAFSFPPLYQLKKEDSAFKVGDDTNLCIGADVEKKCLVVKDNILYAGEKIIPWPLELRSEPILKVSLGLLSGAQEIRWIIGVVTGSDKDERGWVYFFNGQDFLPLITKTTKFKIEPKYNRLGGQIYFGGDLDDFLILYSGYDGRAFYYHQGNLSDVSQLFGLRVAAGGFPAEIIKTANSRGSVFYVCSKDADKFKLIKFWSRQPGELVGSLDFSYLLNEEKIKTTGCQLDKNNQAAATSSLTKIFLGFDKASSTETWIFLDRGFDNSRDRQVTSRDLGQGRTKKIVATIFNQLTVKTDAVESAGEVSPDQLVKFFLANNQDNWQEAVPYRWYEFNQPTESLYWRVVFFAEPGDADYSPWFDNINELLYKTAE